MKKVFLVILPALLFVSCKSEPVKTETRMYELTFVDGKTEIYTITNVDVNAHACIWHSGGTYHFYLPSAGYIDAVIRFKRVK